MVTCMPVSSAAITDDQEHAARDYLSSLIDEQRTPGLQYVFVDANRGLFRFNGGYADLRQKVPVRNDTTFNGYSITKTFTAAAVVQLAIEGRIDLDDPISSYIEDFAYEKSPTVRQTLQHTGGFPNPNPMAWIHRAEEHENFDKQSFIYEVTDQNDELNSEPGEKFAYSNIGYLLLGEVVHAASGLPYDQYVLTNVIKPLSLREDERISFVINHPEDHAHGYIRRWNWLNLILGWFVDRKTFLDGSVDGWVPFRDILVNGDAYGGLIGNASGFARYLQAALRVEEPFTQEMLNLMWEIGTTRTGEKVRTGFAWAHGDLNGERYFGHSGGGGGYYCEIRIYPDLKRASVIMTNNTGISNRHYLDRVDRYFLEDRG
jgi:D-alanyl-D-alanine carboxypeptidase